jgi:AraC-like DNA-binding protein
METVMSLNGSKNLMEALTRSEIYHNYERAFTETTGMPITLHPVESWQLPHRSKRKENPFCAIMAQKSRPCAACLQVQQQLTENPGREGRTVECLAGMSDTAVPVYLGDELVGFLQTGQVFRRRPTEEQWTRVAKQVSEWGLEVDQAELRAAYFATPTLPQKQYDSIVKLMGIFAQHLSMVSNQIVVQQKNQEPPVITRAKEFIKTRQTEDLTLGQVAKAVNASTFYFCKMFKKFTGLNFTEYLSRLRVEKAKNLLLNPNLRVSEIAYEVGFQSLTHFNRVFKRIIGQSPTDYRSQLAMA